MFIFFRLFFSIFNTFIFITDPERYQRAFINSFFSARNSSCSKIFRSNVINTLFYFLQHSFPSTLFYYNITISYVTLLQYINKKFIYRAFLFTITLTNTNKVINKIKITITKKRKHGYGAKSVQEVLNLLF